MTPAVAAKLAFQSVPTAVAAGQSFGVTVWVENSHGHLVTVGADATNQISLIGTALTCTGGTLVTAHGGVATFSGCSLTAAGVSSLVASDTSPGRTGATPAAASLTVTPAGASKLVFISPPASVTAGTATSLTVWVEDPYDNRVTSGTGSNDAVTVSGANCASNTVHATAGQATFTACILPTTAGTHTVTAGDTTPVDTGFTPASATVLVDAGPASQLLFTAPPTSVTVGQTFPLTVLVADGYGNRIRTGTGSSDTIALSGSSLACASGTTVMASAGAATFAGCALSTPPSATLTADDTTPGDTGFNPATAVVAVVRGSTHTSLTPSANPGRVGTPIVYSAKVHSTAPSVGIPSGNVEFLANGHPVSGCTARPLSGGTATCTVTYVLLTMQTVVAKYLGTPGYGPSTSPTLTETLIGNGLAVSASASGTNPDPSTVDMTPISLGSASGMHAAQGSLNITHIADNRGTAAGWTVTGQLQGNFVNATPSGNHADNSIPASNLLWLPSVITGSATGVIAGPASDLSKTVAKLLCSAGPGHGAGSSSCGGTLTLAVPPTVAAGRYTAVLEIVVS